MLSPASLQKKNSYVVEKKERKRLCSVPEDVAISARFVFVLIGSDAQKQSKAVQECELQMEVSDMVLSSQNLGGAAGFWATPPRRDSTRSTSSGRRSIPSNGPGRDSQRTGSPPRDSQRSGSVRLDSPLDSERSGSVSNRDSRISTSSVRSSLRSTESLSSEASLELDSLESSNGSLDAAPRTSPRSKKKKKKDKRRISLDKIWAPAKSNPIVVRKSLVSSQSRDSMCSGGAASEALITASIAL